MRLKYCILFGKNGAVVELKRLSKNEEAQKLYEAREKAICDENARLQMYNVLRQSRFALKNIENIFYKG